MPSRRREDTKGLCETASRTLLAWWLCLLAAGPVRGATFLDPRLHFRTLRTGHFSIHYHRGEEPMARRLAVIAEDVWPKAGDAFGVHAPRHTHVVLADQTELANGWATPLPYNTIFITAAAPAGSEYIGRNDDWLRLVFIHEFTHIVHLDRSEGWAKIARGMFGRTPLAFPNLFLPQWLIEGLAQYEESRLTNDGRRHAGDYRAIEREAGRAHRTEPIDRVNGGLVDWPGGTGGYAYGLGFHEYLAGRFGASQFADLARATAGAAPFTGALAFDRVYGQTVEALWDGYRRSLENRPPPASAPGPQPVRLTHHGFTVVGPRIVPPDCDTCPEQVVYSVRNPHGFPALREIGLHGGPSREIVWRYLGSTVGVGAQALVFDQQEIRRNSGLYSDLYRLDRRTGRVTPLSRESRLQDPDVSPDRRQIVAVQQHDGRRDLVLLSWDDTDIGPVRVLASEAETSFNAPRWSPDGRSIAAARHRTGQQSDIVIVDATTGAVRPLTTPSRARIVTPTWRPDGGAIVAAADYLEDTFNLYEFEIADGPAPPRRLTAVDGGATWPEISRDGRTLIFVGYTTDGFDLFSLPYPPPDLIVPARRSPPEISTAIPTIVDGITTPDTDYSPWPTLAPRTWVPLVERSSGQLRAGAAVGGSDVLGRHFYSASATWLVDEPATAPRPADATPDWTLSYTYDRWQPAVFAAGSSETLFFAGIPDENGHPSPQTMRQHEVEVGAFLPVRRARAVHRLLGSIAVTAQRPLGVDARPPLDRVALRAGASTSSARTFGYSISPEHGVTLGGTVAAIRRALGSTYDATVVTGDVRAYVRGVGQHHVVALRAAGGADIEGDGAGQLFLLGGGVSNGDVIDFGREAFSLLRGFPSGSFAGSRVGVVNVDYRAPLARPQRGIGVWPIFLQTVHGAVFADAGSAWRGAWRAEDWKISAGGELAFDLVAGYSFPVSAAIGAGWGRDGRDGSTRGTIYIRLGRAF